MATAYLGLRGSGDFVTNQRPENWRDAILRIFPNGDMPLTGMTSKMKSRKTDDPTFHWWTKGLPTQRAAVTGIYVNPSLATAYVKNNHASTYGVAGATVYAKVSAADVKQFVPGKRVLLRDADLSAADTYGKVVNTLSNGASSFVAVQLSEAEPTIASTPGLASVDTMLIVGNSNAEGAEMPIAIASDPTEYSNYTQIFRNAVDLTRTAMQTRLRGLDALKEARRDALEQHGLEMEKAFLWGLNTIGTGANGKPERTTLGLIPMIKQYASSNVSDYRVNATYTADPWLTSGEEWFDNMLEQIFRFGSDTKIALCGSGALLGIQRLVKNTGNYQLQAKAGQYGIKVVEWITPFGSVMLKRHPLFSYEATNRNAMVLIEPQNIQYVYIQDTMFKPDKRWKEGGYGTLDAVSEEYLTECGLEYHHPETFGYLDGVGVDNSLT